MLFPGLREGRLDEEKGAEETVRRKEMMGKDSVSEAQTENLY